MVVVDVLDRSCSTLIFATWHSVHANEYGAAVAWKSVSVPLVVSELAVAEVWDTSGAGCVLNAWHELHAGTVDSRSPG